MTSRVQKGGPIFRPVAKSRTRPPAGDNRQSSIPADIPSDSRHEETPTPSQGSMPPPAFVPNRATPVPLPNEPFDEATTQQALNILYASNMTQPRSDPLAPSLLSGRPPTLAVTNSQDAPNRNRTPAPPAVVNRAPPSLISLGALPSLPSSSPAVPVPVSSTPDLVRNGHGPSISPSYTHVLHHSGAENVPKLALDTSGVTIKPQRAGAKKKAFIPVSGGDQQEMNHEQNEEPVEKKVKRKRTSKGDGSEPVKIQPKRKKKNVVTSDPEDSDNGTNTPANKRKRRSSSGTPRPRRSRAPSLPPFDPDADPGEEIDPTVVTMASLCVDTGHGRVSRKAAEILSNHAAWKAQNREKRVRMKALMELKKYGREEDGADGTANETSTVDKEAQDAPIPGSSNEVAQTESAPIMDDTGSGFDYSQDMATSRFNVQVRIGPNGETIIDEESLVVDRTEADDTEDYTHVVESDHTKFVNSGSYGKKFRGSRWSAEETESFYDALSQYGENYELIAYVLPGRDRKSCKNKFKAEDKKNPARINYCLTNSIPVDMTALSRMTGKDFSGPVPEIRAPTPQIEVDPVSVDARKTPPPEVIQKKRRGKKKAPGDDGVVVVGDAGSFVPFPESP